MELLALALAATLGLVHLFAGTLRFLDSVPRSRWLSFGSGISVAYVFIHLLPELAAGQRVLEEVDAPLLVAVESHVWLVALLGLVVFYSLERKVRYSRQKNTSEGREDKIDREVFWLHIGSFAAYNVLVGYLLLHRPETDAGLSALLLFWFAMLSHFVVNDYGLREHHREEYTRIARWVLAVAVLGGCLLGFVVDIGEAAIALLLGFLGGGVVLNVMKEELPEERNSSIVPFALGAAAYAALLLAL